MKAEWAPSEPLFIHPDIAREVAEAENLFQCAAAAHLLLAKEMLEQNPGDEAAKAQATFDLQQQVRLHDIAAKKGDEKLVEIKAKLAAETTETDAETEKPKTLAQTYFAQALSFYEAVADERFAVERTKRMPTEAVSRRNWASANTQMAEFAFTQGDITGATEYYERIENPVQQWGLVAKVHATNPILAKQWERPLAERIENDDYDALTTLAMYKAGVTMRFNQLKTIPQDKPEYATLQDEIRKVWQDAKQLLDKELQQQTMGPWSLDKEVPVGHDVREHLIAFGKLFYTYGDMQTAKEVTAALQSIQQNIKYRDWRGQRQATEDYEAFMNTTELRAFSYGRTWEDIKANAKDWLHNKDLLPATREICAAIVKTQDPGYFDRRIIKNLPRLAYGVTTAASAYLEETYGVSFHVTPFFKYHVGEYADLPELLQTTKPTTTVQEYYNLLAKAAAYERANAPNDRIPMFDRFQAALRVTEQVTLMEKRGVAVTTAHVIDDISLITTDFTEQRKDAATDKLPDLRLEILEQFEPYIKLQPGLAEVDEKLYGVLLDALTIVAPKGSGTTDQLYEKVKEHCELQLRILKAIPNETLTEPRAQELKALLARVTQK